MKITDRLDRFVFDIRSTDEFHLSHVDMVEVLDRQRLKELRDLFDTALNTSQDEIDAA